MESLKTRSLWFLAAFLFLSAVLTVAEVVKEVSDCDQFLLEKAPPELPGILEGRNIKDQNRYKPICQTYNNDRKFLTLYDTKNRIPVFSAYKYRGKGESRRPPNNWKIEPQLEYNDDKNMMLGERNKTYNNQAGDIDYRNNGRFDRGHLFPSSHAFNKTDKKSTFTLTNIVPQVSSFNQGSWNKMETCIKCIMDKYCINNNGAIEGFVVTGAQPSPKNILKNKVNIPSMLWSAFCCYSVNMKEWIASAHWSKNVPDKPKNKYLQAKTLEELHQQLRSADSEFKVFPGTHCPLRTTVTEFYPEINDCHCSPSISTTSSTPTSTSGHPTPTSGPPTSTSGPLTLTSGPLTQTSGPLTPTSGPPTSTSGPPTSTSGPLTPTSGPPTSTSGSPTLTSGPLTQTSGPLTPTSGPLTQTSGPLTPTSGPPTSTSGSPTSTSGPLTSTSGSLTPTSGPLTQTSGPLTPTSGPPTSTSGPPTSTSGPLTPTSGPPTSTSGSPTSTSGPLTQTSGPLTPTSGPPTSTSGPPTSTSGSPTPTSGPLTQTSGPLTPTSGPPTSTSGPLIVNIWWGKLDDSDRKRPDD